MPFVDNEGVRIFYELEGEGYPLVIHHGLTGDPDSWREAGYIKPLAEKYQLILLNVRGHGKSDKPHNPEAYVMETMVSDLTSILDELGYDKAHFFGYSLGGRVGLAIGKYAPDRFSSLIIGGMGMLESGSEEDIERRRSRIELFRKGFDAFIEYQEQEKGAKLPEVELDYFRKMDFEAIIAHCLVREYIGLTEFLPSVRIPSLFYCGELDYFFDSAKKCARARNAQFVYFPGLNHAMCFDRSDLVLPHVFEFLEKQYTL